MSELHTQFQSFEPKTPKHFGLYYFFTTVRVPLRLLYTKNKYSGVPEAYSGLVTFKYASGTPEYIYILTSILVMNKKVFRPKFCGFRFRGSKIF